MELENVPDYVEVEPDPALEGMCSLKWNGRSMGFWNSDAQIIIDLLNENAESKNIIQHLNEEVDDLNERLGDCIKKLKAADQLAEAVQECDEYLKPNPKNSIGTNSILHTKLVSALTAYQGGKHGDKT